MCDNLDNSNDEARRSSVSSGGADSPSPVRSNPATTVNMTSQNNNAIIPPAPYVVRQQHQQQQEPNSAVVARASSRFQDGFR